MKISTDNPPHNIRELCEEVFDLTGKIPVWTFRDTIYNPHNAPIDKPLAAHEATHCLQQGDSPATWWDRYFTDEQFRFEQEVEAYRNQYQEAKKHIKDRNQLYRYLRVLAGDLASPMYGSICTVQQAIDKIKVI